MPCAPATRRRLGTIRLILAKLKEVDIAARTEANREGVADDKILSMMQGMIKQRERVDRALRARAAAPSWPTRRRPRSP